MGKGQRREWEGREMGKEGEGGKDSRDREGREREGKRERRCPL